MPICRSTLSHRPLTLYHGEDENILVKVLPFYPGSERIVFKLVGKRSLVAEDAKGTACRNENGVQADGPSHLSLLALCSGQNQVGTLRAYSI